MGRTHRLRNIGAAAAALAMFGTGLVTGVGGGLAPVQAAPVGQGFTVTASDLSYILDQIKIAEHHAATPVSATDPCAGLVGTGPDQIPSPLVALGLRSIDGSCNNLQPGQAKFGTADQVFPRLTAPDFRTAETNPLAIFGPPGPGTSYNSSSGLVFDTQPRTISNLIVDQTATNPAAIAAAGFPVRTQGNEGVVPCADQTVVPPLPLGCTLAGQTLFIPNVTTDVGLSPPYNSLFTIFGQFFDHGLDKITNGGNGTVIVPLNADDPLIAGPDRIFGNADDLPAGLRFMTLTRGTNAVGPGPDGVLGNADDTTHEALNTDSPWVDLSQAYTSHPSHQVFLREYNLVAGRPLATGRLLDSADHSMANWGDVKAQAATKLGLRLVDTDVGNIPMINADPYGNFIPGPNGLPQFATATGLVEGNLTTPVAAPANVIRINTAFLNDIAHSAGPTAGGPDADLVAGHSLDTPVPAGTYDNELLDLHVIAGDGRANENIGLTSIHTIFEHEHNRLTVDEQNTLDHDAALLAAYHATNCASGCATNNPALPRTFSYGERLFQSARFVTEMEYQHLVFEEFARKVQPAINPFNLFAFSSTATNPAIKAEFAHAVYRFGHSMLDEVIPRTNVDGSTHDIALLDGFLNPQAFKDVTAGDLAAAGGDMGGAGAGAIAMGLSDQVGNELDEFVSDTLRNNLLGLPLDLPSLNMARARSEGIASLNNVRKQIFAQNHDGQLRPYESWVDFGLNIKHPESLINFVAAYGQHPTITAATTLAGKRNAARAIVNPDLLAGDVAPLDAAEFMTSTGAWTNTAGNVSVTGLDQVDLWVGGLAEVTNLFGGLLGTTFNYVFELQMTQLQDNDRLYYLNRTPGMNLRSQLEGNSFAELVMRNTTATSLKADAFATADCKFDLASIVSPASTGSAVMGGGSNNDDLLSECNENKVTTKMASGQIKYRPVNSVDPVGINGQGVYNGTAGVDKIGGGNDNDTILGNEGNDIIEGNGGDDDSLGGAGNDIITDSAGDDTMKGGPGNDALDGGIGLDLLLGGDGKDLTVGGANTNAHFAGTGDDFILAGQGADEVDGDSGDDWMEGGEQTDLLQGDSGSLFFDDHNTPGSDILIGQSGDDDYDMEGGDDIGVAGPGIEKNAGAAGFDWSIGLSDPQAQDDDLQLPIVEVLIGVNGVRDRYNEVEALSGGNLNDILRGDDIVPSAIAGGGFIGCDALDQAGLDRIAGLDALVPALTVPSAPIIANSVTNNCLLVGNVWGEGNILLGGAGSDLIEGRGANDIIDGDRYLSVRLSVRNPLDPALEIGSTDLFEHTAASGTYGPGSDAMTLQEAVFAGIVNPGNIVAVREIITPAAGADIDTALFSGPQASYLVTTEGDAVIVTDNSGAAIGDGSDTLRNIEVFSFCGDAVTPGTIVNGTCDVPRTPVLLADLLLTATPPASLLSADLSSLSSVFAARAVGAVPVTQTVTLSNNGVGTVTVSGSSVAPVGTTSFSATTNCTTLAAGASCTFTVSFSPTAAGDNTARLDIVTDAGTFAVALAGTGVVAPTITGVAQSSVARGATIIITGTDLASTSDVTIGGATAAFTVVDVGTVTAVVPAAVTPAAGVAVTVTTADGVATDSTLTVVGPQPTITLLRQASGAVGDSVIIAGTNLGRVTTVDFNGFLADILSPSSSIQIATTVPAFAPNGIVTVTVTTLDGVVSAPFTVTSPTVAIPAPTLVSFDPASGQRGTQTVLNGANYTTTTTVSFTRAGGGLAPAPASVLSSTQIRVTVPATAVSGPVLVANVTGNSSLNFDVTFPLVVVTPPVPGAPPAPGTPPGAPGSGVSAFHAVNPFRAFDTRAGEPALMDVAKTKVGGGYVLDVALTAIAGKIPASGVAAVSLNVTVDNTEGSGFVTVFPCGARPVVSSVNFVAGKIAANAVIAPVSAAGRVCFFSNVATDIIVDVNGWYAPGDGFNAVAPARVLDTRAGQDGVLNVAKTKVSGGNILDVRLDNIYGPITDAVAAVSLNVTVDGPVGSGFVTVFPCGTMPVASSVNYVAGQTVANAVIATLSNTGHACFFASSAADVVVDVNGWFASGSGYNSVAPARVLDTRAGEPGMLNIAKSKVGGGNVLDVQLDNIYGSATAGKVSAVSLNVTVANGEGSGFVTVFPCGTMPVVSSVNFVAGQVVANAVTATVSSSGHVCFFSSKPTDLVVDVNGWFSGTPS